MGQRFSRNNQKLKQDTPVHTEERDTPNALSENGVHVLLKQQQDTSQRGKDRSQRGAAFDRSSAWGDSSVRSGKQMWRSSSGFLSPGYSSAESAHVRMGHFLQLVEDPEARGPPEAKFFSLMEQFNPEKKLTWGEDVPLEKVICDQEALESLLVKPNLLRRSITIIEPWKHVGHNLKGEEVRASMNVAYVAQTIADCDSVLYPAWETGLLDLDALVPGITSGVAVVVEGGDQSVSDPASMNGCNISHEQLCTLGEQLLLHRFNCCPTIFICLGHQLAAHCNIRLIRRAVDEILASGPIGDDDGLCLEELKQAARRIKEVGEALPVCKHRGTQKIADDWTSPNFSAGKNEEKEVEYAMLVPYKNPTRVEAQHIPEELVEKHKEHAEEFEGVLDVMLESRDVVIAMFHSDEVNEESVLLANWAFRLLHDIVGRHRRILAGTKLSWLKQLPHGVEILASTLTTNRAQTLTEVAATCIAYKSHEDGSIRRSFTCQFHPELMDDMRVFGMREPPSYYEMRKSNGIELFIRLLYAGLQE